ncbi:DUF6934 family protein [Spirosoma montaniterrae]|uniref:Uncharacterized protein n=1 Tax=Spirosoma montaniterrae TaxID=1178516 RepID=A0A1P9WTT3_9BACT|nr:hypothetical protein [Spirosoma montaniterrae]AQG78791.1 hypothetical protein AWR27_05295 [Spirosoma montaniterrae]
MDETTYPFRTEPLEIQYYFDSVSESKTVQKIVRFTETALPEVFNVALLDLLEDGLESDLSVTNNDDFRTVLATVMKIIDNFLTKSPDKIVTFRGSDARRTRLYRIVISREIDAIRQKFDVYGQYSDGTFEPFVANANYIRFLIKIKF